MKLLAMRVAAAALSALATAAPGSAQQGETPGARVNAVRFQGIVSLDAALVHETAVTQGTRCRSILLAPVCALTDAGWAQEQMLLDPTEVRRDEERIRLLYRAWGYPEARVASEIVPRAVGRVDVHFRVEEGGPLLVRSVQVAGLELLPEPVRLPSSLPLRAGDPFAPVRVDATRRLIASLLAERGYPFAEVDAEVIGETAADGMDVAVAVRPGRPAVFGRTAVLPGLPLAVGDVERRLAYRPGDRYRPSALEHTAERLYRLPVVGRVFIDPLPAVDADSVVVVTVGVTPQRVQGLQFGGAASTTNCLEGNVGWRHRYALGSPRTISVTGAVSNLLGRPLRRFPCTGVGEEEFAEIDYALGVDLQEPLGADGWLLLGGEFSRVSSPQAFVREGVQARIGVRHALSRAVDASLLYLPERRDHLAAGPVFCALHGVCGPQEINALARRATVAPLQLSLGWTPPLLRQPPAPPPPGPAWMHLPLPLFLTTGRVVATGAETFTGSEFAFGRIALEATVVAGRGRTVEGAARVRAGVLAGAETPLPPHLRLFGGGPLGVRGVAVNRLGLRVLTATPTQVAGFGCTPEPGGCEGVEVDPREVRVRPIGGNQLLELSVEARRWMHPQLQVAAFVDVGSVHSGALPGSPAAGVPAETVATPGLGALVLSPFGPIRGDVAYDPAPARRYPLVMRPGEAVEHVPLGMVIYDPAGFGDPSPLRAVWRRLQFQLAMGLPF